LNLNFYNENLYNIRQNLSTSMTTFMLLSVYQYITNNCQLIENQPTT